MTSTTLALGPRGGGPGPEIVHRREALEAEPTPSRRAAGRIRTKGSHPETCKWWKLYLCLQQRSHNLQKESHCRVCLAVGGFYGMQIIPQ